MPCGGARRLDHHRRGFCRLFGGEFDEFLAGIPENDSACWQLYRAFVLTSGIVPRDESKMAALIGKIRSLRPEEIIKTSWLPAYEDITLQFATFERDYHVAMLAIHMGREDEAREVMADMERGGPLPGLGALQVEALAGLEAEILLAHGDQSGALQALRTIQYEIPHAISVRSLADGSRTRFLRAELERAAGEDDVARAFYNGLDQSWSWWDTGYRPQAYWGLAKIAERQGHPEEARRSYGRLLDLWQDSDPILNERLAEARETLASLQP
jgi:tetratricopeptide (TPR) repeat protein